MALPFCPLPPARAAVSSMVLSATRLPSWRFTLCQTRMPPLPEPRMTLAVMLRPRLSLLSKSVVGGIGHGVARHVAVALQQRDGVAAGMQDRAIGQAKIAHVGEMHEPALALQLRAAAVEDETGERNRLRVLDRNERRPLGEHQLRGAAHADDLAARMQHEIAGAVAAGRQPQRHAVAGGAIDGALQLGALIVRARRGGRRSAWRRCLARQMPRRARPARRR